MTSLDNVGSSFNGVKGGKVSSLTGNAALRFFHSKNQKVIGIISLAVGVVAAIFFGLIGSVDAQYDFSSSEYVIYSGSKATLVGLVALGIMLAAAIVAFKTQILAAGMAITLLIGFTFTGFGMVDMSKSVQPLQDLEAWIVTNEGLTVFEDGENGFNPLTLPEEKSFTLVDEEGKLVKGVFTEESKDKYVFSSTPMQSAK